MVENPIATLIIGSVIGVGFFTYFIHECSHALACIFFGVPFTFSISEVKPLVPVWGMPATIIGLLGGIGQALISLLAFWIATLFEKRNATWFLGIIGFEISFLAISFMGVLNSLWEGFFYTSYQSVVNDIFVRILVLSVLYILSLLISFSIITKWKLKK